MKFQSQESTIFQTCFLLWNVPKQTINQKSNYKMMNVIQTTERLRIIFWEYNWSIMFNNN